MLHTSSFYFSYFLTFSNSQITTWLSEARAKPDFPYTVIHKKKKTQAKIGLFEHTTWAEHTTDISVLDKDWFHQPVLK